MNERLYDGLYDYESLPFTFAKEQIDVYYERLLSQFSLLTKNWNDDLNTEWIARNYLASKMIMSATLMLNSAQYAFESNLRVVEPYLLYYSVFGCCKAAVLTHPNLKWEEGAIFEYTHQKVINLTGGIVANFDRNYSEYTKKVLTQIRDYRELFSYKFPTTGLKQLPEEVSAQIEDVIELCRLLVEVAEFQSERLDQSFTKNCKDKKFGYTEDVLKKLIWFETYDSQFYDDDDYYRLSRFVAKGKKPTSLSLTMNAGMVDDFFGAWTDTDNRDGVRFDPDNNIRLIYDFP